jgi:hypothetical protein
MLPVRSRFCFRFVAILTQINISPRYSSLLYADWKRRPVMSTYHVSFFKNLLSSDGHPFKCLQRRIDIIDAESAAQAAESASRSFEAVCGFPWKLHADSIEINVDHNQRIERQSNIRAVWPS